MKDWKIIFIGGIGLALIGALTKSDNIEVLGGICVVASIFISIQD